MTSSLVGSEMCIRDRRSSPTPNLRTGLLYNSDPDVSEGRPPRVRHCFRPVSYTHLTLPTICSV
eukprot:1924677-Prorocentrum_lima.AAC.1